MADDDSDTEIIVDQRIEFLANVVNSTWRLKPDKWQKMYSLEDSSKLFSKLFDKMELNQIFIALTTSGSLQLMTTFPETMKSIVKIFYFIKRNPSEPIFIDSKLSEIKSSFKYGEISPNSFGHLSVLLNEVSFG